MNDLKIHPPGLIAYVAALAIVGLLTYTKILPQETGVIAIVAILGLIVPSNAVRNKTGVEAFGTLLEATATIPAPPPPDSEKTVEVDVPSVPPMKKDVL